MTLEATRALKQVFLEEYGHFADKRLRNIDKGSLFIIDDRGPGDFGADRHLFGWFCLMFAEVVDYKTVLVRLSGSIPKGVLVENWFSKHNAISRHSGLEFRVRRGSQDELTELAEAFKSMVEPGALYTVPSYKYVCPRVANALVRLQKAMNRRGAAGHQ